jgi:hypothetical protein
MRRVESIMIIIVGRVILTKVGQRMDKGRTKDGINENNLKARILEKCLLEKSPSN